MIGYYAHHRGAGHVQRAAAIAAYLPESVTVLSSAPSDDRFDNWVELPFDHSEDRRDVTANGTLHWVPLGSSGLRDRMAAIASWIAAARPSVIVADVSAEVALLARLHGIPVVTIGQPGDRDDPAHTLAYRASTAIIAPWPESLTPSLVAPDIAERLEHVGAISRIPVTDHAGRDPRLIGVLKGFGSRGRTRLDAVVEDAKAALHGYRWSTPSDAGGVAQMLATCGLVITHAGQNAIAEVAATRTPAIVVAEERPHDEQLALARALRASAFPVSVAEPGSVLELPRDGDWSGYCDGRAAERAAAIIQRVAL